MKKYFILAVAAIALAACSNDESDNVQNDNVIRLTSSVGEVTRAANDIYGEGTHFAEGTAVTVKVTDQGSNPITYTSVTYTDDGAGNLTCSPVQYYPASGNAVNIYAYYPSTASTSSNGFTVNTSQDSDEDYKASDLMYASISNITKSSNDAARTLTFNHLLSKIVVTLVTGDGMTDAEIGAATVTLKDVIIKGTFTLGSDFGAAADEAANRNDITIATNAGTTPHAAIVVPQSVAGKKIGITINGHTEEYTIPDETSFSAATHNDYTITVAKTGITGVTATIGTWGTGTYGTETLTY